MTLNDLKALVEAVEANKGTQENPLVSFWLTTHVEYHVQNRHDHFTNCDIGRGDIDNILLHRTDKCDFELPLVLRRY